jgi:hypothetical protein
MDEDSELVERVMAAMRQRLNDAVGSLREARTAVAFAEGERELAALAQELTAKMVERVVERVSKDPLRRKEARELVRERAKKRGVTMVMGRDRTTRFRTLGGGEAVVFTPYARAKVRGGGKRQVRGKDGTGVYYVLDQLGIRGRSTPAFRLQVAHAVCEANSVTSAREVLATGGVDIDHKAALRLTYMTTTIALAARAEEVKATTDGNDDGEFVGRRIVASVDGGRLQVRRRVAGRPRAGGRKHFETEWREPKVLTIYVLDENGRRDRKVACVLDATLGGANAVFELLLFHLRRVGAHKAAELTLIGDGAEWIWTRADDLRKALELPKARFHQVLDYFHVAERLHEFAKTRGWDEGIWKRWYQVNKGLLKDGQIGAIEVSIRAVERAHGLDLSSELAFWAHHKARMQYGTHRHAARPIGSGAVESTVRRVVNLRLKGASVFWTEEHAEGVLHLRAQSKSGRWKQLERTVLENGAWQPTSRIVREAA